VEFANPAIWSNTQGLNPSRDDDLLYALRDLVSERSRKHQMTGATLEGVFQLGKPFVVAGQERGFGGFGHMGCCSLFQIQRVHAIDTEYDERLNYSRADWNIGMGPNCFSEMMLGLPTNADIRGWQQAALQNPDSIHFDPQKTAAEQLKQLREGNLGRRTAGKTELISPKPPKKLKPADDGSPTETLIEAENKPYLKRFYWLEADRVNMYEIVVTRPYWLLSIAGSAETVIWVPTGATLMQCKGLKKPWPARK
jgi:hypothetical protein